MTPVNVNAGTSISVTLSQLAVQAPEHVALVVSGERVTRQRLENLATGRAYEFASRGVDFGARVVIGRPNGTDFIASVLATWKLGAVPVPVSPRMTSHELQALVAVASPTLVDGDPVWAGRHRSSSAFHGGTAPILNSRVSPNWKATTTGGSTGTPKLILARQAGMAEPLLALGKALRMPTNGVHLSTGPLSQNGPFLTTMLAILSGSTVVVMPRFDAEQALSLVEAENVEWMYAVPTMMQRISRLPEASRTKYDLSSLKTLLHTAAPCPTWLKQEWIKWLGPDRVWELYSTTEGLAGTMISGSEWLRHPGSIGRVVAGEIRVKAADGSDAPTGQVGELWARSSDPSTPYEYLGAVPVREDGWEYFGDLGWRDADDYLYLTERECDVLVVGGTNVYPAEIEAVLDSHPAVRSSCVIGVPDDDLGVAPHALVELGELVSDDELHTFVLERLAPFRAPRGYDRMDRPLRDDGGKMRRRALRDEYLQRALKRDGLEHLA